MEILLVIATMILCLVSGYLFGKGAIVINKTVKLTKQQETEINDNLEKDKLAREKQEQIINQYNNAYQQLQEFIGGNQ